MCEPISITAAVVGATALAGGVAKGVAAKQAADASANAQRRNALLADDAASQALQRGSQDAGRIQMQGSSLIGAQTAGYGTSGADVGSGSALRTTEDTAAITELDKMTAMSNAQREAWGLKTQATNMRKTADSTETAGNFAMGADIIGGAANAASIFTGGAKAPGN